MCQLLHVNPATLDVSAKASTSLPLAAGGLGLRSAERLRHAAFWASLADMMKMLHSRVPSVATNFIGFLEVGEATPSIQSVLSCVDNLAGVGFVVPLWEDLVADPPLDEEEEIDPAQPKRGWQKKATWVVDSAFHQHTVFPALDDAQAALLRSQAGPMAFAAFVAVPSMKETRIDPQPFRLLFLRRLRLPLPLQPRSCRCGRPLDVLGHHHAACANAGVLGRRGWVLENVAARVCREAGGRVRTNLVVRDMDLGAHNLDGRRLEIIVDGLLLWGGSQLAVDTTMVSPLTCDGVAQRGTATTNGKSLARARRRKELTYPKLTGEHGRARLVVMGVEVGGRWSAETSVFLRCLAAAKARGSPPWIEGQVRAAWLSGIGVMQQQCPSGLDIRKADPF